MNIVTTDFGRTAGGTPAHLYTLVNDNGMSVTITDFGGAIVSILAPDRNGKFTDVVLGYHTLADYEHADGYLGALVGRYANRIAGGSFELDGVLYDQLYINDGGNHLHGGRIAMSKDVWGTEDITVTETGSNLTLCFVSHDGEEGYPGEMTAVVGYRLDNDNALSIDYTAWTDKACPVNLTNHVYFNLAGNASGSVLGQELWLDAESYCRGDDGLIPTGELVPIEGTPFDFRTASKPIGRDFFADNTDLRLAGGYDHCFNFTNWKEFDTNGEPNGPCPLRAVAVDPVSGRGLEMYTNQPCVQFYSANFLKNPLFPLRGGVPQRPQSGFCLETQRMPDSPHHQGEENFTNCILRPGEQYHHKTVYKFIAK